MKRETWRDSIYHRRKWSLRWRAVEEEKTAVAAAAAAAAAATVVAARLIQSLKYHPF